jgi:hypothetical protein
VARDVRNVIATRHPFLHRKRTYDLRKILASIAAELVLDVAARQLDIVDLSVAMTARITAIIWTLMTAGAKESLTSLRTFEDLMHGVGMAF